MKAKSYPKSLSEKCTEKILEQMKKSFYKLLKNDGKTNLGLGFFSHIKCDNIDIPVIIINSQESYNENIDTIKIIKSNVEKEIKLGDIKIKNRALNITVVEIKEEVKDEIYFLKIDERLYKKDSEYLFENESIYTIQYINAGEIHFSLGSINNVDKNSAFKFLGDMNKNSKISIIFNSANDKITSIFKEKKSKYINKALFFNLIIDAFIIKYKHNLFSCNEINILIKIAPKDIKKNIYFIDNYEGDNNKLSNHIILKELNNIDIYVNEIKYDYKRNYFIPEIKGKYKIKLKFKIKLRDYSYMFANCHHIINISFISFNAKNATNFKYMFYECDNIETINMSSVDTKNVSDMSCMFYNCKNLKNLDLSVFDLKKIANINCMFYNCTKLEKNNLPWLSFEYKNLYYLFHTFITMIYKINKNEDMLQLFGYEFVINNENNCYL